MGSRHQGRELALQVLYQVDVTSHPLEEALSLFQKNFSIKEESWSFAKDLVSGIYENKKGVDKLIEEDAEHWKLSRMTVTDRNIMRLAVYELTYRDDIPSRVTLNEAIELGKKYGTEESGAFINGILDKIYKRSKRKD